MIKKIWYHVTMLILISRPLDSFQKGPWLGQKYQILTGIFEKI